MPPHAHPDRPVILTFNRTYLPGYRGGGPIRTIANMVEQLGDRFEFRIVTQDRDAGPCEPYPGIVPDTWTALGKGFVRYIHPAAISIRNLVRLIRAESFDVLYLNSFFDRTFTTRILTARGMGLLPNRPTVLAPRGEFSPGALRYKSLQKRLYVGGFQLLHWGDGVIWQASTPLEKADVSRMLPSIPAVRIMVACDLASAPTTTTDDTPIAVDGPLRILFLSRISPMKNLAFVLAVLARVRCPVALSIIGPRDEDYWQACQPALRALPPNVTVDIHDSIPPLEVPAVMRRHDLLFLPTQGENFGHVIHEALSAGLPVLISDRTPWTGVTEAGAGWSLPLVASEPFVEVLTRHAATDATIRAEMRRAAMNFGRAHSFDASAYDDNVRLFRDAIAAHGGPRS